MLTVETVVRVTSIQTFRQNVGDYIISQGKFLRLSVLWNHASSHYESVPRSFVGFAARQAAALVEENEAQERWETLEKTGSDLMELRRAFDLRVEAFMKMKALFEEILAEETITIFLARYETSRPAWRGL